MSNGAIELHDSATERVLNESGKVTILFSPAYVHQSGGKPGIDPGSGWHQKAALIVEAGEITGALPEFPMDISSGLMILDCAKSSNLIPIPFSYNGDFRLHLTFVSGNKIVITGSSADLALYGEPEYLEEFPGAGVQNSRGI